VIGRKAIFVLAAVAMSALTMRQMMAAERSAPREEMTVADIEKGIKTHQFTCAQVIDYYIKRINEFDKKGPAINAILTLNESARDEAKRLDVTFDKKGLVGPLHCIPIALKDNIATSDLPTTGGSVALQDWQIGQDATVVRRLRAAGAIILAKANLHEFALVGLTNSSLGGQTRNPYDLTRTPGGSSGGPGAAVASNFVVAALGTDTQNSIRSPASAMSVVGLRPTRGLVSRAGVMPVSSTQDALGPITRTTADAAAVLSVIQGYDPGDEATAWIAGQKFGDYTGAFGGDGLKGARIGVMRSLFGKSEGEGAQVNAVMSRAIQTIREAGATMLDVDEPDLSAEKLIADNDVMVFEFRDAFNGYLKHYSNAPVSDLHALIETGKYDKTSLDAFLKRADAERSQQSETSYAERIARDHFVRQKLITVFASQNLDALVYPEQRRLVVKIGETDQAGRTGILAAVTGFPAITVPAGFSEPSADAKIGVPIGMDILGRPFSEARLLAIASSFERAAQARRKPPYVP
jgi:amidase